MEIYKFYAKDINDETLNFNEELTVENLKEVKQFLGDRSPNLLKEFMMKFRMSSGGKMHINNESFSAASFRKLADGLIDFCLEEEDILNQYVAKENAFFDAWKEDVIKEKQAEAKAKAEALAKAKAEEAKRIEEERKKALAEEQAKKEASAQSAVKFPEEPKEMNADTRRVHVKKSLPPINTMDFIPDKADQMDSEALLNKYNFKVYYTEWNFSDDGSELYGTDKVVYCINEEFANKTRNIVSTTKNKVLYTDSESNTNYYKYSDVSDIIPLRESDFDLESYF